MVKSGVITEVVETPKHIQLDLSYDEATLLRECLESCRVIPFHFYNALHAAINEYERLTEEV